MNELREVQELAQSMNSDFRQMAAALSIAMTSLQVILDNSEGAVAAEAQRALKEIDTILIKAVVNGMG